jgi:hypothetical protein
MLIHSVAVQNQDPAADGVFIHELPTNPLSLIFICLRPLNETSTLTNWQNAAGIAAAINRVTVRYRGQSIFSMSGADALAYAFFRHGLAPFEANGVETDNDRRCVIVPICLGKSPYSASSCFPEVRASELQLELDLDVADTGYDDLQYTVETVELLGAKPKEYERVVDLSRTNSATGLNDIDLPIGNLTRGVFLFATTGFAGSAPAPSFGRITTVIDGVGVGYSGVDWETLHAIQGLSGREPSWALHRHLVDATAADANEHTHTGPMGVAADTLRNYAYLNFDVDGTDSHSIDTSRVSRFQVRADVETADAIRIHPVERIAV